MKPKSVWLATLAIAGSCLASGPSGVAADEPKPAEPAPPDAVKGRNKAFVDPLTALNTFLAAIKANDRDQLAEAISLYAPSMTQGNKNHELIMAIIEKKLSDAELRKLASEFEGYTLRGVSGHPHPLHVSIARTGPNGEQFVRVIAIRHEKKGWKIADFSEPREVGKK